MTNLELLAERFPADIALAQARWERRQQVRRANAAGAQYKVIAATAGQSIANMQRHGQRGWAEYDSRHRSPAEAYQERDLYNVVQAVASWGRHASAWRFRCLSP